MLEEYIKGERIWTKKDNTRISYKNMTVAHIKNVMKMLSRSGKFKNSCLRLEGEILIREVSKLLEANQGALASWLTSENKAMRELAKRTIQKVESE